MDQAEGTWRPFKSIHVNGPYYGGLVGKAGAFVKYIQELLRPDSPLVMEKYNKMLFKENFLNNNKATGMCLAWFQGRLNGQTYFAHAGGGGGYYCELRIYPDLGIGSVIFFNRTGLSDERFLNRVDTYSIRRLTTNH